MNNTETIEQTGDIRDIKGLEHFTYSPLYYIIPALLLLALVYLGWRLYKRRRDRMKIETIPPPPPDKVALRELNLLRSDGQFEKLGEKFFNFRLSAIFRSYLEGRYDFPASDMTTEEIMIYLPKNKDFDEAHTDMTKMILTETDKVKFAKYRPGRNVALGLVENALEFVGETKVILRQAQDERKAQDERIKG